MLNQENNQLLDSKHTSTIAAHYEPGFDKKDKSDINWSPKHEDLVVVEEYLHNEKFYNAEYPLSELGLSYDVTAKEPLSFHTLNYTTFAGCVILHPLNWELMLRQMADAYADNIDLKYGHVDFIRKSIESDNNFSKYDFKEYVKAEAKQVLVVLPGGNKLKKHCCIGKLQYIIEKHGIDNVLFKKHPISHDEAYQELAQVLGDIHFADAKSSLYNLINNSEIIYTTFISESALISFMLGKEVDHIDLYNNRDTTSFGHINHYLFTHPDPVSWAQRTFASPKSGVIQPQVDNNWKHKVDKYLDYITELRNFYKQSYIFSR